MGRSGRQPASIRSPTQREGHVLRRPTNGTDGRRDLWRADGTEPSAPCASRTSIPGRAWTASSPELLTSARRAPCSSSTPTTAFTVRELRALQLDSDGRRAPRRGSSERARARHRSRSRRHRASGRRCATSPRRTDEVGRARFAAPIAALTSTATAMASATAAEVLAHGTDPLDADSDDDGLGDAQEVLVLGTDPLDTDSDDDGRATPRRSRPERIRSTRAASRSRSRASRSPRRATRPTATASARSPTSTRSRSTR